MPEADRGVRRSRMRSLILKYLVAWLLFGLGVTVFVAPLNHLKLPLLGFPLGIYLAAQGALIMFVVMLFTFAQQRERTGREPD